MRIPGRTTWPAAVAMLAVLLATATHPGPAAAGMLVRLTPLGVGDELFVPIGSPQRFVVLADYAYGGRVVVRDTELHTQRDVPRIPGCYYRAIGGGRLLYSCDDLPDADGTGLRGQLVVTDLDGGDVHRVGFVQSGISSYTPGAVGSRWVHLDSGSDKEEPLYVDWRTSAPRPARGVRDLDSPDLALLPATHADVQLLVSSPPRLTGRPLRVVDHGRPRTLSACRRSCYAVRVFGRRVSWLEGGRLRITSLDTRRTSVVTPPSTHPRYVITAYELIIGARGTSTALSYAALGR